VIVGLLGFIGSGKGSAADHLVENHGFIKESFANSVKDATSIIFGWDRTMLEGDTIHSRKWREEPDEWWSKKMGKPFSPRQALQLMGTEAGRDVFHKDIWMLSLERRLNPNKDYIIADVRFPNEIKMIEDLGGKLIWVRRGHLPEWYSCAYRENTTDPYEHWLLEDADELMEQKYPDIHFSEWAWIGGHYDMSLDNNGTLEELRTKLDKWLDNEYNGIHVEGFDPSEVNLI
jgi:hypothetical protein